MSGTPQNFRRPVKTLPPEVARKIAAGEVIDRPAAIVRELMDNAVDSGADMIHVEITGGGIDRIRVVDNGSGMTKEDLEQCARPHATSGIPGRSAVFYRSRMPAPDNISLRRQRLETGSRSHETPPDYAG